MPATSAHKSHFRTIQTIHLDYAPITVTQYESTRTGMRVVVTDQAGPKVNGYFALATEIHDDSGAPHTLEHLVFMGSKSYRYKGLLDKLATRAYSTTNAWTATEQTAYTLDTAGWEGFAQILPVYLEHVIVPTLTDAACYTEVHHIDGTGQDAGVVYSEMQGVQNTQEDLMQLAAKRLMYPAGNGFRYETGGMMEQLRVLTADRIRQFHKEMYQPKNLCLVLTGEVNHPQLLHILDQFEDTILEDVPSFDAPFHRPWTESKRAPALAKTVVETVKFPEEDESMGEVLVAFFGPEYNDHKECAALGILLIYLCGSSISVLENTLVEREQLCSMIYYNTEPRPNLAIEFQMSAVETGKLKQVEHRLIELLGEVAANDLDMAYMHDCIRRWRRQIKMKCEGGSYFFANPVIEDHLFGSRDGRDLKQLATLDELDALEKWSESDWRGFFKKYLVDAHHISVLGEPSKELSERITADEKERVQKQKERLGEEGLEKLGEKLKKAQAENDKPIPDSVLEEFPVPSAKSVHFISTTTARAGLARKAGKPGDNEIQRLIDEDDHDSPLYIHYEHIPSNFVRIKLDMCTAAIPLRLKPLISLYMMNLFTTPVYKDGKRMEFEEVVLELERETVAYGVDSESANYEMLSIALEVEPESYERIIGWLRILLFDAIHDAERLYSSLTKLLADIPDEKRSGDSMVYQVTSMIQYKPESSVRARSTLAKAVYLRRIRKLLKADPKAAIAQLDELCRALSRPENFRIFVSADIQKLSKPVSAWKMLISGLETGKPLEPLDNRKALLSQVGRSPGHAAYIIPMAAIDSSYAFLTGNGPEGYDHADLPAYMVARAYMDAVEGPLWVAVRGTGLAYGTGFSMAVETGKLLFRISRSPDTFKAFTAAKEQVEGYASGKYEMDKFALEGAVSEIVLGMADEQPTFASAAEHSFGNQAIRGISKEWNHQMLGKVQAVTPQQVQEAMRKYMVPIFRPESSNLVVTCAQIMKDTLEAGFKEYKPEVRTLESFEDDYGAPEVEGDDDDGEEEEDGDDDDDEDEPMDTPESEEED
ncbi:Metalloenzyme, LuxS/M16 peptidase-like protein [Neohortaea acidophila]|uniref:Metalloenzyme, LuxS/M16 peptidase-like protein n=1 Tax=Neohortaea acidophila TaxID=245834 RepID=A0A6A6PL96_9PEZI|nr:Metalloenzyme, LuxS/M16 peptidase-like protein [Neohortaea acidophila]KAF2480705.1 Metalloenzyme, LuxS/M16 peptidase-like protein [Neohortaea acidophila]